MTTPTDDRIEAVTTAIARSLRYDSAPHDTARNVVEALDELRTVRHIETRAQAVAVVEHVLADCVAGDLAPAAIRTAAAAVVERLLDDPVLSLVRDDDGTERVVVSWPHDAVRACLASREALDGVVETLNAKSLAIAERDRELADALRDLDEARRRLSLLGRAIVGAPAPTRDPLELLKPPAGPESPTGAPQAPQDGPGAPS